MESKKDKQVKFPTFWTYLEENGVKTIHQVRFTSMVAVAVCKYMLDWEGWRQKVINATFEIAGKPGLYCCGDADFCECNRLEDVQYHKIEEVFSTKEKAMKAARRQYKGLELDFEANGGAGSFFITGYNPLFENNMSPFSWYNNLPEDLETETDDNNILEPYGFFWNGTDVMFDKAKCGLPVNDALFKGRGETGYSRSIPLYDMVSGEWLIPWKYKYYQDEHECENANALQVFTFED